MIEHLAHLHDTHDRRLDEYLAVFLDVLVGGLLFHLQFGLEREVDVDSELFVLESVVQFYRRARREICLVIGRCEQFRFQQNLEHLDQALLVDAGIFTQLLDSPRLLLVELQKDGHLEGARLKSVPQPETVGDEFATAHVVQPVELPSGMLLSVEVVEPVDRLFQLKRQGKGEALVERPRAAGQH